MVHGIAILPPQVLRENDREELPIGGRPLTMSEYESCECFACYRRVPKNEARLREIGMALVTASVTLIAIGFTANAKDVTIGSTSISLTAPPGYCELNDTQERDAEILKTSRDLLRENQLLAAYAECQQLNNVRSGKAPRLDDFVMYFFPLSAANMKLPPDAIKQVCAKMREKGEQILAGKVEESTPRVEELVKGIEINETRFVGVLAEEPGVCYSATLQRFALDGREKTQFNVAAAMVVASKFVHYQLFTPYRDAKTPSEVLTKHKANVSAFLAANRAK